VLIGPAAGVAVILPVLTLGGRLPCAA